jgi:hypothetical protein
MARAQGLQRFPFHQTLYTTSDEEAAKRTSYLPDQVVHPLKGEHTRMQFPP